MIVKGLVPLEVVIVIIVVEFILLALLENFVQMQFYREERKNIDAIIRGVKTRLFMSYTETNCRAHQSNEY